MQQLASLDAKMTYSQARSAAAEDLNHRRLTETIVFDAWHKKTPHSEQQQPHQQQGQRDNQAGMPTRPLHRASTSTASRRQPGGKHDASSGRGLSIMGSAAAAHRDPEAAAAAAAGALSEMKQWAIAQELSMMEVCVC